MRITAIAILCLLGASCATPLPSNALRWTPEFIGGLEMTLIDANRIGFYHFDRKGFVSATLGTKEAVMGPLWYWKLHDNKLQITDGTQVQDEWTLLSRDAQTITVRRITGETDRYKYSRPSRSNQSMQPTPGRRTNKLSMTRTSHPAATRALASGG